MQKLAQHLLHLMGWKIVGQLPEQKKYLIIVAPHTSNWDLVIGLVARFATGAHITFLAKKEVFFFPLGLLLKALGGTPVNRDEKGNKVQQVVELYKNKEEIKLALTPEGTRGEVTRWKEGFYHIACQAQVPLVMIGMDYKTKEVRIAEPFMPTGDISQDFEKILSYFRTIQGCYPKELPNYHRKDK